MYKIYSRKRLRFKNIKGKGKITKIILILIIAFETAGLIMNYANPIFEQVSIYEAKKLATFVANDQTTKRVQMEIKMPILFLSDKMLHPFP